MTPVFEREYKEVNRIAGVSLRGGLLVYKVLPEEADAEAAEQAAEAQFVSQVRRLIKVHPSKRSHYLQILAWGLTVLACFALFWRAAG